MAHLKKMLLTAFAALVVVGGAAPAGAGSPPQTGRIVSENSVDCGTKKQGKKEQMDLVCQEYVLRTSSTEYHIRQPKQKDQGLLSLNSDVEFVMDKDKMKVKSGGKTYEFLVVSETALTPETKQ